MATESDDVRRAAMFPSNPAAVADVAGRPERAKTAVASPCSPR
jgi:hypothetical protein